MTLGTKLNYGLLPYVLVAAVLLSTSARGQSFGVGTYVNPVIPGDHPDPTLTRIGNDYYSSGSSFNVTPKIYHSTDLVHWEVIAQPVAADWDLYGDQPGGGIWGGHMVYQDGLYWHFFGRGTGDRAMYFVTSNRPEGPWSTPFRMNVPASVPGFGVDNSLFIDDDNRWFLLTKNGHSNNHIVELGPDGQPAGEVYDLTWLNPDDGNGNYPYGWAEGPVLWKHDGYYYYSFAEHLVGTQYVMRSDTLSDDPDDWETPRVLFESVIDRNQRAFRNPNHNAPAVTTVNGTSWIISQAYDQSGPGQEWQALGRQGVLSQVVYEDRWPVAKFPSDDAVEAPRLPGSGIPWTVPRSDRFDGLTVAPDWSFLGYTPDDTYSITERPGWLRLEPARGRFLFGQNTVIQNAAEHAYSLITRVDFTPNDETDEAGLWTFNGPETLQARLYVTAEAAGTRAVAFSFEGTAYTTTLDDGAPVWLRLQRNGHNLTGSYSLNGIDWTVVGEDINVLRMDREQPSSESGYTFNAFTGNQQGLYVMGDMPADFDLYIYRDAYSSIPAQYPSNFNGVAPASGYLTGIHGGEWAMYAGVEFGAPGDAQDDADYQITPEQVTVMASSETGGGVIEVWLDSLDTGQKVAELTIENTGDWDSYVPFSTAVAPINGQHDVFLKFVGSPISPLFRLQRFAFTARPIGTAVTDADVPAAPSLGQNYPNPFGPNRTTIGYVLPTTERVTLSVYNLLGQEVATLVDEVKPAGLHTATFGGRDFPSGVYFYRLVTESGSATKTMTVIR